MHDIVQYTNIFSDTKQLSVFIDSIYKYSQNPLILPVKVKLVELLFSGLKKIISEKRFKQKLQKDMNFQSMFTSYMMEVDTNPNETSRLENLRKLLNAYLKNKNEGLEIEMYEIYQIAKKLRSFEFVVLYTTYEIYKNGRADYLQNKDLDEWRKHVSTHINDSDSTRALIYAAETKLVDQQLLLPNRAAGYNEYRPSGTFRLTQLGIRMCELLVN